MKKNLEIHPGDLVKVYTKIKEGDKERIAPFQGIIIKIRGSGISRTITVRKISAGIGIERIFPIENKEMITKIEIKKKGKTRRAKLTYLRQRKGKKLKIKDAVSAPASKASKKPSETDEEIPGDSDPGQEPVEKA
ncbi:50S ribosomal protein L19 [candidate division WOR-3 bacterium RBG_13_43_14]|uniref:50S ribosomal protein L19 n=1 Tax=candidate division WOR-3 bacterium RBG_13_43_14 TaxID=1802590 RepID=A0A1F4U2R9_UNCW3|nr:MAG: 50S ribosomal protein L19 [candidate division WOR-3 bacterium RBG_13_43_14]